MTKSKMTVGEVMALAQYKKPLEDRKVGELILFLRKLANDFEQGKAIEMDFNIEVEEMSMFDCMDLKIQSYHFRPEQTKHKKLKS